VKHVSKAVARYVKKHRAPVHKVLHMFKIWLGDFEMIRPIREDQNGIPKLSPRSRSKVVEVARVTHLEVVAHLDRSERYWCGCSLEQEWRGESGSEEATGDGRRPYGL